MKKRNIIIVFGIIFLLTLGVVGLIFNKKNNSNIADFDTSESYNEITYVSENNNLKFVDGEFNSSKVTDYKTAIKALKTLEYFSDVDLDKTLKFISVEESDDIKYYKFNQIYNDIEVYNQKIILSVDSDGKILSYSGEYIKNIDISTNPRISKEDIENYVLSLNEDSKINSNQLFVWNGGDKNYLVYNIVVFNDNYVKDYMIDANNKEIYSTANPMNFSSEYNYTGKGIDNETFNITLEEYYDVTTFINRYKFYDKKRNIAIVDTRYTGLVLAFFTSLLSVTPYDVKMVDGVLAGGDFTKDAISTLGNYEKIYDYYYNVLGRNSYDNKGSKIIVNLGVTAKTFTDEDLNNAAWNSANNQMYIGNYEGKSFSASLDILGHEFTHGVISAVVNIPSHQKENEQDKPFVSGAINEGYSDVLGSLIEGKNWTIGENITIFRDLTNPELNNNPKKVNGKFYYPDGYYEENFGLKEFLEYNSLSKLEDYDKGGVHHNSTIIGYSAYLMEKNGAFSSKEEMAKVWYNSLFLLNSYPTFNDVALAVIKSAKNLNLSENSINIITSTFYETNMLESKTVTLSGKVTNDNSVLSNADIFIYNSGGELVKNLKTNNDGKFEQKIKTGSYKLVIKKDGYKEYTKDIIVLGNMSIVVNVAVDKCCEVKMYYFDSGESGNVEEKYTIYTIERGQHFDKDKALKKYTKEFNLGEITSDGESFYIDIGGLKGEISWYYKGTDKKFNWDEPINDNVEIEMKVMYGLIDDEMIKDITNLFN